MSRFSAVNLDLSRLQSPQAIRGLGYESILAQRMERLRELLDAAGIEYDALGLESDPAAKLQETDAYRELLNISAINDAVRSGFIAFAVGSDLDHLGAFYGTARHDGESDADYRRRILLAPEAFSAAGTQGAYMYHALAADPRVRHVDAWSPAPGQVIVAIQSREGKGRASDELVEKVRLYLSREDIKPLTDALSVRSASIIDYEIELTGFILPGPAPDTVREDMVASIEAMTLARKTPSRDVPLSAIKAAAHVGPVDRVVVNRPTSDVIVGRGEVPNMTKLSVKVETYDG